MFKVICVDGSPTDWAAILPTASPGAQIDELYFAPIRDDNSCLEMFTRFITSVSVESMALEAALATCSETHAPLEPIMCPLVSDEMTGSRAHRFTSTVLLDRASVCFPPAVPKSISTGTRLTCCPSSLYFKSTDFPFE